MTGDRPRSTGSTANLPSLGVGKWRGLQTASTARGLFTILALDHRQNLRPLLHPEDPNRTTADELTRFKLDVTRGLARWASAVLLDPIYGAAQSIATGALSGQVGLIVALEETGYEGEANARRSRLVDGWGVEQAKRSGADGAKLLVYYHPDASTATSQEAFVRRVADECRQHDLALYLEPLTYSPTTGKSLRGAERRVSVIETARRLAGFGIDVLKVEFPTDADASDAEAADACAAISEASVVPWVLLSGAVPHALFVRHVRIAVQAGAAGVMVGRALWNEATGLQGEQRTSFLEGTARRRMDELVAVVERHGRPWHETLADRVPVIGADRHRDV